VAGGHLRRTGDATKRSVWQRLSALALLCLTGLIVASCENPTASLESVDQVDLTAKTPRKVNNRGESPAPKNKSGGSRYEMFPATAGSLLGDDQEPPPGVGALDDGKFTVNVDQASLPEAAKLILGETLGYSYIVDPRVQGSVSLVSNGALSARELLSAFEAALRLSGAALIQSEGTFKIVALQEVLDGEMGKADFGKQVSAGYGVNAIPLRYINPATLMELVDSFVARSGSVRASKVGNMILIRGPAEERRALVDVVLSFDVDWMKTQTASIAILENGRADDVAKKVEAVFAEDTAAAGPNALKIIPVPRINGIIAIANSQSKVRRALNWIKRLDQESVTDPNVYVYAVQNGNATELAKILRATFMDGGGSAGSSADVAPDRDTMAVSMNDVEGGQQQQQQQQPAQGGAESGQGGAATGEVDLTTPTTGPEDPANFEGGSGSGTRVTPNPSNNTIVIRATPKEYRKILAMLRQIDAPATQVLINTTIAEVVLNNELRYGVQAYLNNGDVGGGFFGNDATRTRNGITLKPAIPGMNFFVGSISDPQVVIDALSGVTKVRVVSSPSVLVLENETATIKVGDQVPIQTQTLVTDGGNSMNSYEYRDTGVILKVKPRVNANGVVTIELGQELSAERPAGDVGVGNNPTFTQRSITSKVSVNDQQTVLLGGLISGREDNIRQTVPGANKVPLLGNLVGTTDNTARRNELIIFITPKIIRNGEEAARESQDLRDKMRNLNFN
jgi:general secretion pathway protein D